MSLVATIAIVPTPLRAQQNNNRLGQALGNFIGGLINNAARSSARKSWLGADPEEQFCLTVAFHFDPVQFAAHGISATDSRLRPYFDKCREMIANTPSPNRERFRAYAEQYAVLEKQNLQAQANQDGERLFADTLQNGITAFQYQQQKQAERKAERRAAKEQQAELQAQQRAQWLAQYQEQKQLAEQKGEMAKQQEQVQEETRLAQMQVGAAQQKAWKQERQNYQASLSPPHQPTAVPPATVTPPPKASATSALPSGPISQQRPKTTPVATSAPAPGTSPPATSAQQALANAENTNAVISGKPFTFVENEASDGTVMTVSVYQHGQLITTADPKNVAVYGYEPGVSGTYQVGGGSATNLVTTEASRSSISSMPQTTAGLAAIAVPRRQASGGSTAASTASAPPSSPPPPAKPVTSSTPPAQTAGPANLPTCPSLATGPSGLPSCTNGAYVFVPTANNTVEVFQNGQMLVAGMSAGTAASRYGYGSGPPSNPTLPQSPSPPPQPAAPAYTFNTMPDGNVEVYKSGQRISTGTPQVAAQYGYRGQGWDAPVSNAQTNPPPTQSTSPPSATVVATNPSSPPANTNTGGTFYIQSGTGTQLTAAQVRNGTFPPGTYFIESDTGREVTQASLTQPSQPNPLLKTPNDQPYASAQLNPTTTSPASPIDMRVAHSTPQTNDVNNWASTYSPSITQGRTPSTQFNSVIETLTQLNAPNGVLHSDGYIYSNNVDQTLQQQCAILVQALDPTLGSTNNWISHRGVQIAPSAITGKYPSIPSGTPIATFRTDGGYPVGDQLMDTPPNNPGASQQPHSAIFLGYLYDASGNVVGMNMLEQQAGHPAAIGQRYFTPIAANLAGGQWENYTYTTMK